MLSWQTNWHEPQRTEWQSADRTTSCLFFSLAKLWNNVSASRQVQKYSTYILPQLAAGKSTERRHSWDIYQFPTFARLVTICCSTKFNGRLILFYFQQIFEWQWVHRTSSRTQSSKVFVSNKHKNLQTQFLFLPRTVGENYFTGFHSDVTKRIAANYSLHKKNFPPYFSLTFFALPFD